MDTKKYEEEKLVVENQGLVPYMVIHQFNIGLGDPKFEDYISEGKIGLIKAARTFKPEKKITFATYAARCIQNEIFMYMRREKKHSHTLSLESDPLAVDTDGKELLLQDILEDEKANFEEDILRQEDIIEILNIAFNTLTARERIILFCRINDRNQKELAEFLNISQSYISRIEKRIYRKIKDILIEKRKYWKKYTINFFEDVWQLTFSKKELEREDFQEYMDFLKKEVNLKVIEEEGKVKIQVPVAENTYIKLSFLLEKIEEMKQEKKRLEEQGKQKQKIEQEEHKSSKIKEEKQAQKEKQKQIESEKNEIQGKLGRNTQVQGELDKGTQIQIVIAYIQECKTFSKNELRKNLKNILLSSINAAIYICQKEGKIKLLGKGIYEVNKD